MALFADVFLTAFFATTFLVAVLLCLLFFWAAMIFCFKILPLKAGQVSKLQNVRIYFSVSVRQCRSDFIAGDHRFQIAGRS